MNYKTVAEARRNGFKVRVGHYRISYEDGKFLGTMPKKLKEEMWEDSLVLDSDYADKGYFPRGGRTSVELEKDGKTSFGISECSFLDNYNKKVGVEIALRRAFEAYNSDSSPPAPNTDCPSLI